ncbi:unnamed protein product [Miscanthus lutarioriparius]|uniref:Uncharacterized protein n=1 Tax=Miscanthus lutarioriparius TaxID=422564 RepID=A0A811SH74_9POAL|nr:unnamed protein product [Miscanthus lutarioriparius]
MEPEAAALSQLQLQLLALVSEFRLLRERERGAREELRDAGQRWEAAAEEHRREARELRAELAARDDSIRRLEARIKCLENENELLEKNENNLKESMEDEIIERLTSENQAMRLELHNMEIALQKFQDLFSSIGNERMKNFSAISESQGVQDVNNEQLERVPGSQCGLANEHTSVTAIVKEATTQNVDHQLETDPGSMQVQSPVHFKSGALPSPELVSANTETADSLLEPKGDIDMGGLSRVLNDRQIV